MLGSSLSYLRRPLMRAAYAARFPDASHSRSSSRIYEAVARGGSRNPASGNAHFRLCMERYPAKSTDHANLCPTKNRVVTTL